MVTWKRPVEVLTSDGVKELGRLQTENERLRSLCARAYKCARHSDHATCEECIGMCDGCTLKSVMRELGIEVRP